MGNAINNGTLNGKNLDPSNEGRSCLYHAELPNGITDIALVNTSNGTLNFNEGGYQLRYQYTEQRYSIWRHHPKLGLITKAISPPC
jgi:hypothetical protein